MESAFDRVRGTPEAILMARNDAEIRVAMLEANPPHRRAGAVRIVTSCGRCAHLVHADACKHDYCSCPALSGADYATAMEEVEKMQAQDFQRAQRIAKWEADLAEARAALEAERA